MKSFTKSFTQQEALTDAATNAALNVMRSGRLHRYNTVDNTLSEVDQLEIEFADYMGVPYCLACASWGYALHIAMRAAGIKQGDKVLSNAFTLAPVPGAIHNSGALPILVNTDNNYCIDLEDLAVKAQHSGARYLVLSHMRGHIADMDRVMSICKQYRLFLIEDCAHTMGAHWDNKKSGTFGDIACFSTQTYKHINSGEGGLLISAHDKVMARAIIYSGSYMLFEQHQAAPPKAAFERICYDTPNFSGRMDNLRAAILRPQLSHLDNQCQRWNQHYHLLAQVLQQSPAITLPERSHKEQFVGSSIQFSLPGFSRQQLQQVVSNCHTRGVSIKWFGDKKPQGYTSRYDSWQYIDQLPYLPETERILSTLLDMRIPLTFDTHDCQLIGDIIVEVVTELLHTQYVTLHE